MNSPWQQNETDQILFLKTSNVNVLVEPLMDGDADD